MFMSGLGSFEIIQKALVAGVPIVACVSAASSLAAQLAWEFNLTPVGFLRGKRFVVYTGKSVCGQHVYQDSYPTHC
jgi:FdhD protein